MRTPLWFMILGTLCAAAQPELKPQDSPVIPLFQKTRPELKHFAILLRRPVDNRQDLLVAFASPRTVGDDPYHGDRWWAKDAWIGLFLQERDRTASIQTIVLVPAQSEQEGVIRIRRVSNDELLLIRLPEKGGPLDTVELLIDARAGRLIRDIRYTPFRVSRIAEHNGVPYFLATNQKDSVVIRAESSNEYFRIVREAAPVGDNDEFHGAHFGPMGGFELVQESGGFSGKLLVIVERTAGKTVRFPLPQSTVEQYTEFRPAAIRNGWRPDAGSIQEEVGPFQVADGQLWFGRTFYDSEGTSGIGGFGYFDSQMRKYRLFSPPEIRNWSVSAILVEPDALWLSLFHRGEYGDSSGGVIRFDRATQHVSRHKLPSITNAITRYQGRLYFATSDGIAFLDSDRIREFLIDYAANGLPRLVERTE
jgi:hypothetical protein